MEQRHQVWQCDNVGGWRCKAARLLHIPSGGRGTALDHGDECGIGRRMGSDGQVQLSGGQIRPPKEDISSQKSSEVIRTICTLFTMLMLIAARHSLAQCRHAGSHRS
ncbi:hypothetical protein PPTG_24222 [Phytophthora nicotianae INRA-310]|uniref:Uncharacterized protein n=2 Tax=Phytophthora nicotianae TaxID=4792 RepID=W2PKF7_PHYN3|nr:hypothetical protein PPTG_24222 [Phytophthora nicotianae INRA-310]ETN00729.1 hypothetical protein PPTG_24222 [Phytophthora nicotianae INRA-310]ETO62090.1 hypothetical protein F444_19975 [Phytophthora nicotianae P1976]